MNNFIVGMGEALWDVLPNGKKIGGAPANFAFHISQFGLPSRVVSAIGNDPLGKEILECFQDKHLDGVIATVPYPTGTVQVTVDNDGIPHYDIKEGVAWDNIPYTTALKELARQTQAVCFGSLAQRSPVSRQTIQRFLDDMPNTSDTIKIFDINLRQHFYTKDILHDSLMRCNILKINDEELKVLSQILQCDDISMNDQCKFLTNKYNLRMVILTCGINGSLVYSPEHISFKDTPQVQVADTVGAGDSFTAAFVAAVLKGKDISEAHELAVATSAYVCSCQGAMPVLPSSLLQKLA